MMLLLFLIFAAIVVATTLQLGWGFLALLLILLWLDDLIK